MVDEATLNEKLAEKIAHKEKIRQKIALLEKSIFSKDAPSQTRPKLQIETKQQRGHSSLSPSCSPDGYDQEFRTSPHNGSRSLSPGAMRSEGRNLRFGMTGPIRSPSSSLGSQPSESRNLPDRRRPLSLSPSGGGMRSPPRPGMRWMEVGKQRKEAEDPKYEVQSPHP